MAQYGVTVFRDDSEPSVLGSARTEASVYLGASGDLRAETHTLDSVGISNNEVMSSIFQLFPATSLNKFIVKVFSDGNISMLMSSKKVPIIPKMIYKSESAFINCKIEWKMSLLGIMILIGYQSKMGSGKYAWKRRGVLSCIHLFSKALHSGVSQRHVLYHYQIFPINDGDKL